MASTPDSPAHLPSPSSRAAGSAPLRIAGWLVDPSLHRITGPEGTVTLEPKVLSVLLRLARRPGDVVAKEDLLAEVWNGTFVTDDVLTRAIAELRRAFGDDAAAPRVIETIRKGGYRLIAPVEAAPSLELPKQAGAGDDGRRRRFRGVLVGLGIIELAAVLVVSLLRSHDARPFAPMRIVPLTAAAGSERDPAVSPDGTRVAYVWNGGAGEDYSLYVKLTDGGAPLRLTREAPAEDRAPAWSPDGRAIAFTRATDSTCDIWIVPALGGSARRLAPCGDRDFRRLAWSPDGRSIAISRRDGGSPLAIESVSVQTGDRRVLTQPPAGILGDTSPAFAPDGSEIAFDRNISDGAGDIYTVSASGGEPRRVTFDARDLMGLDWAADGNSLIFSSSRAGIYSLWRVAASGGEPVWFAGAGTKMKHPSTARAAGRNVLAFENWTYEVNLWRVLAGRDGAGEARRVTETTDQWNFQPAFSPDGRRLAFVSTRTGEEQLWSEAADGSGPTRVTSFEGARIETPRWSPDGKLLVFSARMRGRADLYAVAGAGGPVQRLTREPTDAVLPSWSADGRSILFASRRGGAWDIWRLALADRRITRVTGSGGYASRESADGRFLYFTRTDAAGVWRQPADGSGGVERVAGTPLPEDWANWELGHEGLYVREFPSGERRPVLALYPFASDSRRQIISLADQGWPGFAVAPDGDAIVYPRIDRQSCEIRVIENYR